MSNTSLRKPQKGFRRGGKVAYHGGRSTQKFTSTPGRFEATSTDERWERTQMAHQVDEKMGFERIESGKTKEGWLVNIQPTSIPDSRNINGRSAVDCYFIEDGNETTFKATVEYEPYFLIAARKGRESEVEEWVKRIDGGGVVKSVTKVEKEDLSMPNHLLGYRRTFLKLSFLNVSDLMTARREIMPIADRNKKNMNTMDTYAEVVRTTGELDLYDDSREQDERGNVNIADASDYIVDIREYDVPYHVRVMIDLDIRVGRWYFIEFSAGITTIKINEERLAMADPVVMAYDIETCKSPLKFPDSSVDQIMMVSYMIDGQGFLITNREIVSEDIADFDYTPKPEYPGAFIIFNEPNERTLIERFFEHIKIAKPTVIATYNGDFFDWPYVEARAAFNGIDMYQEIGWKRDSEEQFKCNYSVHMDCFHWVNRDSYLPQGSRGLKAVTVAKLGYDPDELDPELMTPYASERPQTLAEYSVSDAVATYYLYMKYVHPFIFSLCTILPLGGDDTLRKGTGTLCEMLLMVQAYQKKIILPNKHVSARESFWEGHLLESETYVGGHVESIEAGVFRSDIPVNFAVQPAAVEELLRDLDAALKFSITVEENKKMEDIVNYEEVRDQIAAKLTELRDTPHRHENPLIYHLDVASMYPNIMTTNRLQPDSMVQESDCAACDFNRPGKTCDRRLPWSWRGEYIPAKRDEYNMIRNTLEGEKFPPRRPGLPMRSFQELSLDEQAALIRKRLQLYSQKIYHKIHESKTIVREAIICQRENPFYINTVRDFRDRRYDYKGKTKVWKGKTDALKSSGAPASEVDAAKKMIVLFDSLQLAHKVILNSFYGYVMRKGSRWHSMEMAGVTCLTGATIIQLAKDLVDRLGRPLELDTDGIWCMLPATFPENFSFKLNNGKKVAISYPCVMLNHLVHAKFTNHQYQTLVDPATFKYETHSDNSIFFEVDGPYKAMVIPTSKEEDKNLKKRYAVFNDDGSLAELKGFEVKRRGELKLIKIFQQQIFKFFLEGDTLAECYVAVAKVANRWLDVLHNKGLTLSDEELMELISENRSMSKTLEEYGSQKSTSITTARWLADFLGEGMVKDKGLNCKFIISHLPRNAPVTERAIPVAIFSAPEETKRLYLRKWLKEEPSNIDPRALLDWNYYLERLGSVIQKLITIPAALQKVRNPVPRVAHPDWLQRRINQKDDKMKQKKLSDMFTVKSSLMNSSGTLEQRLDDVEDYGNQLAKAKTIGAAIASSQAASSSSMPKRKAPDRDETPVLEDLPKKMPDPSEDYVEFLLYQKRKWKMQKEARARRRQLFGDRRMNNSSSIQQTMMKQAHSTFTNTWQILHLKATDSPGIVMAYVLIDAKIHPIKINVPRQLYVNFKTKSIPKMNLKDCSVKPANVSLPSGHLPVNLVQLTMSEATYMSEMQKWFPLLNDRTVEGVYEQKLPLNMRALLQLGNSCTIDQSQEAVLGKGLEHGFDLPGLKQPDKKRNYLESVPLAFIYISQITTGDKQIYGIFSSRAEQAHIVILQRSRDAMQDIPNISRIYGEKLQEHIQEIAGSNGSTQDFFQYQEKLAFKLTQVTTQRKAHLEIGDIVKKMNREELRAQVLVIQSSQRESLIHNIPVLGEFPTLPMKYDVYDGSLPPLGWQPVVVRRLVRHYLRLAGEITHFIALSRYADIPLCNLEKEDPRFLIDIAYARRLQANSVALWWSNDARPDHGGYEKDNVAGPLDMMAMPQVNNPGTYMTVCIEMEVRNLAINTILTSSLINALEGSDGEMFNADPSGDKDGASILYSHNSFSGAGIRVLRGMVKSWWSEACKGSPMADLMVNHLLRWVENPDSYLYDNTLHRYVQLICRKAFQQLMGDFRKVGCQVIFANSSRLILQTTKQDVETAYAFGQYITKSIKTQPLFHFIDLDIKEYWDYLVWYDEYNYGGVGCDEVTEHDGNQQLNTVMHWQMQTFLPPRLQSVFGNWVVEFIRIMHNLKRPNATVSGTPRMTQIPMQNLTADPESNEVTNIISGPIFEKPLKKEISGLITRQKKEMMHSELAVDYAFPKLPGSHISGLDSHKAVLELVKAIMQILSLDKNIIMEARLLRKELLQMFDISDFSTAGAFRNPSESLVLRDISCENCAMPREFDFCRDEDLLPEDLSQGAADNTWRCTGCGFEFSRMSIEERLIAAVEGYVIEWTTQDQNCKSCGAVKLGEFMDHCTCSGEWKNILNRDDVVGRLKVYKNVAEFYDMRMLFSVVGEILESI
ncbi:hypothetical protein BROUX41_003135 [Berkeleyomyces rouxiae]